MSCTCAQVRDLHVELATMTSQHASTLDAKRVLEDRQALMTQELNELRARQTETAAAAARSASGESDVDVIIITKECQTKKSGSVCI